MEMVENSLITHVTFHETCTEIIDLMEDRLLSILKCFQLFTFQRTLRIHRQI